VPRHNSLNLHHVDEDSSTDYERASSGTGYDNSLAGW
jgi:hypothetical protein